MMTCTGMFSSNNPGVVRKLPKTKLYLDITFMVNFIMDFVILLAAARLSGSLISYLRLLLAAGLGAVYACAALFWPGCLVYSLPAKLVFSILMLMIAFYPSKWGQLIKQLVYFYCISLFAAGAAMALPNLGRAPGAPVSPSLFWLAGAALLVVLLAWGAGNYLAERIVPGMLTFDVEMRFESKSCSGCGFLDTGNALKDPLTDRPVLVAEYSLLKNCLPPDFCRAIEAGSSENDMIASMTGSEWAHRLRLIPFQSIGQKNGMLVGVRADEVVVDTGRKCIAHHGLVVALYLDRLSADDSYRMLIPAAVLDK